MTKHKFRNHKINPETKCLIIGTFNPDTPKNTADFFYGTGRNELWKLLPAAFGIDSLKSKARNPEPIKLLIQEKRMKFMRERGIDFIDIISEVKVETDREHYRRDDYIGGRVSKWAPVKETMEELLMLERVCFTRKTFKDVPGIENKAKEIAEYCEQKNIHFKCLVSPSGLAPGTDKQAEWTEFFNRT
jgi:hypothetical protein